MIEFAFAGFLAGMYAVALPIILHFLKRKPTEAQSFPAFKFLRATAISKRNKNNLLKWLVLMMRCLMFIFMALAFSWPYLPRFVPQPDNVTVLLWDQSLSMSAEPYRDELRQQAFKLIGDANIKKPMLLGVVSDRVQWSGEFSGDTSVLKSWFEKNSAGQGSSRFESAIRQADARLRSVRGKVKQIILVTDFQTLPWQDVQMNHPLSPGVQFQVVHPKKTGFQNVAVTQARVTTPFTAAQQSFVLEVKVQNFRSQMVKTELVTEWQGKEVDRRKLDLLPDAEVTTVVSIAAGAFEPQGGSVRVVEKDDIELDNRAWVSVNPAHLPQVFLSSMPKKQTDFIQTALVPSPESRRVDIHELREETSLGEMKKADLIVVREGMPLNSGLIDRLDRYLRDGGHLFLTWQESVLSRPWLDRYGVKAAMTPDMGTFRLGNIDFEHPIFRPFLKVRIGSLFDTLFFNPPAMTFPPEARILATLENGKPLMGEIKVGEGNLFILASGVSRASTDWPTHASFLPFCRELFAYTLRQSQIEKVFTVSAKALPIEKLQEVKNLATGKMVSMDHGTFIPLEAGNFLVKGEKGEEMVSINVPTEDSNPLFLNSNFSWKTLVSAEKASVETAAAVSLPLNQGKQYWWILLLFVFLLSFGEILLANRTAL